MKGFAKICGAVLLLLCCAIMIYAQIVTDQRRMELAAQTTITSEATIPCEERIVLPDPNHFFGVEELKFEEYPEEAVRAYCRLLEEQYGLVLQDSKDAQWLSWYEYGDSQNGGKRISIRGSMPHSDGLLELLFYFSDECCLEPQEHWDGDISLYLYDPSHWELCEACDGAGLCKTCHGSGEIDTGLGYDKSTESCPDCKDGDCSKCSRGKVKVATPKPKKHIQDMTAEEIINEGWDEMIRESFRND